MFLNASVVAEGEGAGDEGKQVASASGSARSHRIIKVRARVCQSLMVINEVDTNVSFGESVIGKVYSKTITVWNRSEVPLRFRINRDHGNKLTRYQPRNCLT